MAYRVELTHRAERDLEYLYDRIAADDSPAAARWFNGIEEAIYALERFPRRCPVAPESKKPNGRLRHLLYGAKRDVYRVIYEIDQSRKVVRILTISTPRWTSLSADAEGKKRVRFLNPRPTEGVLLHSSLSRMERVAFRAG
jgi:plasmid stabilization system protein ParE